MIACPAEDTTLVMFKACGVTRSRHVVPPRRTLASWDSPLRLGTCSCGRVLEEVLSICQTHEIFSAPDGISQRQETVNGDFRVFPWVQVWIAIDI